MAKKPYKSRSGKAPKVANQSYEMVDLADLRTHPRNVNHGDLGAILESIDANGFYGAIVAQRSTGYILAGNHRYMALREQNAAMVPNGP